jgi:hypothetical protein
MTFLGKIKCKFANWFAKPANGQCNDV